ncbi:2-oxoglutarate dehydrogenase, E2 component, dihydrolipoamide succinyltransferase [Aeromicrobium duanguangcaii]|uniref:Dihydrolipoamide acetyltransferase component of pyruvate dehydrogenase complex n=1 Tax=Aeromicrobium duanguangcaii TaxID=2968086 RepID=A0ABY5KKP3_9ACTN|nr:2-oxoglutarate dehydrogenase, E2 component, dihydrolipoamide succinyltransferase [Aeromicrobium duanguangcaii]MCD9153309.1 2-oxoglutarate dehydrogenase, E2 component, dihydrolipoamide succinyltransferase [Aeromicrobium duanguangcaii]UUI69595.1 2-oxoglutarate dehydrogenase, E2 component, dihydrolipoamide succinyltransferase [Aeromicrobium duanguangcaii]
MATEVTLPALGESVTEGTVTQWLKSVGDTIEVDEPLLEISTDKVDTEIPSPVAGTILEIRAEEDDTVEVGAVLAIIGDEGESSSDGGSDAAEAAGDTNLDGEEAEVEPQSEEPAAEAEEPAAEADEEAPAQEPEAKPTSSGGQAVTLPALGESVTEGTVTQWLKSVGDTVEVDEPLLEISTDKVDTEIPSPVSGTLLEIKVAEDETVEVGAELAIIGEEGAAPAASEPEAEEPKPEPQAEEPKAEEPKAEEPKAEEPKAEEPKAEEPQQEQPKAQESDSSSDAGSSEGYVTPIVRKLAKQHGVDLAAVTGSGVGGRIRKQDILDAAEKNKAAQAPAQESAPAASSAPASAPSAPSPLRGRTDKLTRLRKTIATRMVESLQVSAQLTQVHEVDVTEVVRLRAQHKDAFLEREGVKLTYLPFFAKAAIEALKQYPQVNAALDLEGGTVTYPDGEHLSIAVDTERGLLAPTIKDAGDLNIAGLARKIADIADRTRNNKVLPDELSGGTFSITNLGSNGALFDTPIINQPQVAILGVGSIVKRPVVITDANGSESIAIRSMAYLALTYDHRIIDGADAGRFLTAIKERLQAGAFEGELG